MSSSLSNPLFLLLSVHVLFSTESDIMISKSSARRQKPWNLFKFEQTTGGCLIDKESKRIASTIFIFIHDLLVQRWKLCSEYAQKSAHEYAHRCAFKVRTVFTSSKPRNSWQMTPYLYTFLSKYRMNWEHVQIRRYYQREKSYVNNFRCHDVNVNDKRGVLEMPGDIFVS